MSCGGCSRPMRRSAGWDTTRASGEGAVPRQPVLRAGRVARRGARGGRAARAEAPCDAGARGGGRDGGAGVREAAVIIVLVALFLFVVRLIAEVLDDPSSAAKRRRAGRLGVLAVAIAIAAVWIAIAPWPMSGAAPMVVFAFPVLA